MLFLDSPLRDAVDSIFQALLIVKSGVHVHKG
jgi:hypothetical protein